MFPPLFLIITSPGAPLCSYDSDSQKILVASWNIHGAGYIDKCPAVRDAVSFENVACIQEKKICSMSREKALSILTM
jgi:hypothetical protein